MNSRKINSVSMVLQSFYPAVGGAERQAFELARALVSRGIKVTVLTRKLAGTIACEELSQIQVLRLGTPGDGLYNSAAFMLYCLLYLLKNAAQYDIVHVHLASSHAVAAELAAKFTGKKTFIKLADGKEQNEITLSQKTFWGRLKLLFFRFAGPRFLVLNSEVYEWLKTDRRFSGLSIKLIHNGVDTGKYTPPLYHEKLKAKDLLGLGHLPVFLFVGRLDPKKRIKEFIEIWAEVFQENAGKYKAKLVLVGTGTEESVVKKTAGSLGLSESIVFAGSQKEVLPYYRAADVFILPSLAEGLSNSMLEAMSCGLAVMASRVGGAKDAVSDGVSGCLFDPQNRTEIKKCLKQYLDDPGLALRMGEKARDTAVKTYCMSKVAEEILKLYEE